MWFFFELLVVPLHKISMSLQVIVFYANFMFSFQLSSKNRKKKKIKIELFS